MRTSAQFAHTIRRGRTAGRADLIVHACAPQSSPTPTLVGFVVGRGVGGSVVRHRVVRRLRAVVGARLAGVPAGTHLVIRARPGAAQRSPAELAEQVDSAFRAVIGR
jgi:ribonuclease P protein component